MAMMSQRTPFPILSCPAGACRQQAASLPASPRPSWRSIAAGFAAGALLVSGLMASSAAPPAPSELHASAVREARAAEWAAFVRAQTPRELPREWRQEIRRVDFDAMIRTRR